MLTIAYAYQYHVGEAYNAFSANGTQEIQLAIKLCKKDKPLAEDKKPIVDENADKVAATVIMLDEKYGNPVAGNIVVKKGKTEVYTGKGDASGITNIYLAPNKYEMLVTATGYLPQLENVDLSNEAKGSKYEIKLKPVKLEKGLVFKFKSINFETGSDKLKTSSYQILDKIADIMLENPNMVIEIAGYTDNVGDDAKNKVLSEKRAQSVLAYLTAKGVKTSQMKAVGYGEANPIATNDTEEGRLQNRRVMFTVIEF
jgi:outer membrane protein OmpA-like peptidoglycan-associated protein